MYNNVAFTSIPFSRLLLVLTVACILILGTHVAPAQTPTISSFTPSSGVVGTTVTITGTNFNATAGSNVVFFGATKAMVTAANSTQLTVTVPVGASYAPITVLNASIGLLAYSNSNFTPTYTPNKSTMLTGDFATKQDFGTGSISYSASICDLDGDGKTDLAVANYNSNTVSVLRNTSTPSNVSFATKADFGTGTSPQFVSIGDLDGDGRADLAVVNTGSNTVSVFRNTSTPGSISFAAKLDFGTGSYPIAVSIGDLDGDGRADLAVANYSNNTVSVLRNTGTIGSISFATKTDFGTGTGPVSLFIGDLDGDSVADLTVANYSYNTISVFRNASSPGSISFVSKVDFGVGTNPSSVSIGDLDGDGRADLAVANYNSSTTSLFRNTCTPGTISFATKIDYFTGPASRFVSMGDLDGDGRADLAVSKGDNSSTISVFRNTGIPGSFNFAPRVDLSTLSWSNPQSVSIGDLNGDGRADLAVAYTGSSSVSVIKNNPPPTITSFSPSSGIAGTKVTIIGTNFDVLVPNNIVKFNGTTAIVDVATYTSLTVIIPYGATTGTITIALGSQATTSSSNFTVIPPPTITSFNPVSGAVGTSVTITGSDFNATAGSNAVFFGATKATVTAASSTQLTVTVPVGASYAPITVLNTTSKLMAYSNSNFTPTFTPSKGSIGTGDFANKVDFRTGAGPWAVSMGDLDGDGKADLAVVNTGSNTVSVFRNTGMLGTVSYAAKVDFGTGYSPVSVSIGDLDGDGKADLAVANFGVSDFISTVSVFRNTSSPGTISFASRVNLVTGYSPTSVSIGDLDGDGKADLIVTNESDNNVSVLRNTSTTGSISFALSTDFNTGARPQSVSIGDLDGDGKADLAVANLSNTSTVSVLRNTSTAGSISFATKKDFGTGSISYSVSIGDLDGDGKADLAVANYINIIYGTISVLKNNSTAGSISFASQTNFDTGLGPCFVSIGDLNGDSMADLATANYVDNTISVLRNIGTPGTVIFADKVDFITGTYPNYVSIGDLDGDGRVDLATANYGDNTISVIRNLPPPPTITSFSPISGIVGTVVTITGTNFDITTYNNTIQFNGASTIVTAATSTSLTTTVPIGATTGTIGVAVSGQTATSSNSFTVIPSPIISSFTPTLGAVGINVTITGTNFDAIPANNTVKFNGISATVTAATSTSLIATVPTGATTGTITVTAGGYTTISNSSFTVIPPPTIISFSPASGPVGVSVTITGTNFGATTSSNTVKFNGTVATVSNASSKSLTVKVPTGTTSGAITVTVGGATATSTSNFTVTTGTGPVITAIVAPSLNSPLSIYPNPSTEVFMVKLPEDGFTSASYQVTDLQGKVVASGKSQNPEFSLSLKGCVAGTYILKVDYNGKGIVQKILKE